jgi:hypothetical protein
MSGPRLAEGVENYVCFPLRAADGIARMPANCEAVQLLVVGILYGYRTNWLGGGNATLVKSISCTCQQEVS